MSNEMKVIMERWDKFVVEEEKPSNWATWRVLHDTIELVKAQKKGEETVERKKALLKIAGKQGAKFALSFLGPLGAAIDSSMEAAEVIKDMVKTYAKEDDSKTKQNPLLDLFNLDDGFEDLIDDNIEDKFIQKMIDEIPAHIEKHPDQVIPDFDKVIQAWLPTIELGGTMDNNVIKQKETK